MRKHGTTPVPYLEPELPGFAPRVLAAFILLVVLAAGVVSVLVPFPETVDGTFQLIRADQGAVLVWSPVAGVVQDLRADMDVRKGTSLIVIRAREGCPKGKASTANLTPEGDEQHWCPVAVRAPKDGVVEPVSNLRPGDKVDRGQPLFRLAEADSSLVAEAEFEERDLAALSVGEDVVLQFRALPFNRYGVFRGRVASLGRSIENGRVRVQVAIDPRGKTEQGEVFDLKPGMTGQARIRVGTRTLVEHVLQPLR